MIDDHASYQILQVQVDVVSHQLELAISDSLHDHLLSFKQYLHSKKLREL